MFAQSCSVKKVFLEIWQNSQENTCARVSFLKKVAGGAKGTGATKFLSVIHFVAPIRTFRVKSTLGLILRSMKIQKFRQGNWQRQFEVCKAFT